MKDKKFEFIIIGILIILIGYFGYKYYMNDGNRELIKRLEQEEKSLKEERRLNKSERLVDIIKTNPQGKYIVFSEFNNTFVNIIDTLNKNQIKMKN